MIILLKLLIPKIHVPLKLLISKIHSFTTLICKITYNTTDKVASFFARHQITSFHENMFKICQEIQELFFNDCLGKIEYCLNTISTSDNNTTAVSDIQIICKDYKDSFDFMSSHGASQNKVFYKKWTICGFTIIYN